MGCHVDDKCLKYLVESCMLTKKTNVVFSCEKIIIFFEANFTVYGHAKVAKIIPVVSNKLKSYLKIDFFILPKKDQSCRPNSSK